MLGTSLLSINMLRINMPIINMPSLVRLRSPNYLHDCNNN